MQRKSINFDWNRARAFLVTAEEGSLSAAARALGMTQPTLGRQVAALESELGVILFERGNTGLALTPSGKQLLKHVQEMGEAANYLSLSATGQSETLEGTVSISATETMATYDLPSIIPAFRALYPGIKLEIIASHDASDLKKREADIAIRAFRPTQPDLIARKLRDEGAGLYATPAYLRSIGNPKTPTDLSDAAILGFNTTLGFVEALNSLGLDLKPEQFVVYALNHVVQWEMVKAGVGIGVMVENVGDREPLVERVLPDLPLFTSELWLVTHGELRTTRRVKAVFDFLAEQLASTPNINA